LPPDTPAAGVSLRDLTASFLLPDVRRTWPPEVNVSAFLESAAMDGVVGLLYARLHANGIASHVPASLIDGLRSGAHRQAATEMAQRLELQRLVAAMYSKGLDVLLMKGASLAYSVYGDPSWRVRSDVDMFIRAADRAAVRSVLEELDYVPSDALSGDLAISQFHCERVTPGLRHLCDVHWQIVNRLRFAGAVRFDELADAAMALPTLGPGARGLGHVHALWLACVHRAVHHYDQDTLLWLYDVHLLVEALDAGGLDRFVALAERTGVRRICLRALSLARERLGTRIPRGVLTALEAAPADEPSTVFLNRHMRQIDVLRDDLRVLPGWRDRLTLLKEHLFPDAFYMHTIFAPGSSAPVAWLYLRRIVAGARKWLSSISGASR
jgi:hypothetical protein